MIDLSEHEALGRLHQAETTARLGKAVVELITPRMAHEYLFIAFLPIKFELPSITSKTKYKAICDGYVRQVCETNKYDIWLRRSPIGPSVTVVRHSDHTPLSILKRSVFYKEIMQPTNAEHGASIVAWHQDTWLATMTILRNEQQGDFSDEDMRQLFAWQRHFEIVVRKLALKKEEQLDDNSLSTFIWDLPTSALLLDWDLVPRHFNAAAVELCTVWRRGLSAFSKKSQHNKISVPNEILALIPRLKPRIESAKLARPGPLRPVEFETLLHPDIPGLFAKIYFIPSKSLTISRGRFLVQLYYDRGVQAQSPASAYAKLSRLSRTEREVALQAAKGLSNIEIAEMLRKSPGTVKIQLSEVFKKLRLKSRTQLANVLSSSLPDKNSPANIFGNETIKIFH
jgi:DNA-binding CsgD family transcriptional regulator